MNPDLLRAIQFFTRETGIMDAMAVACGDATRLESARDAAPECPTPLSSRTLFDLASITKLFTGLSALRLREEGLLDFSRSVFSYDPRFESLREVTVDQLLSFAVELRTPGRVDACPDRDSALRCLFGVAPVGPSGRRPYSDIPALVLKYVLESASGLPYLDLLRSRIFDPLGMRDTFARVPPDRLADCLRYDREHRIEGARRILRQDPAPGVPHDPKAALLQGASDDLCGHAGLFSTLDDLVRLCRGVLGGKVISPESLRLMAVNRTGRLLPDGTWSQHLGYQCYVRHPDQFFSEIPSYMGLRAVGIAGFTGNHLSLDPDRGVFCLMLGNRVRNRLTVLLPEEGKTLRDYGLNEDGSGLFRWSDEELVPSSVQYVHQKDLHLHRVVARVLGLRQMTFAEAASLEKDCAARKE